MKRSLPFVIIAAVALIAATAGAFLYHAKRERLAAATTAGAAPASGIRPGAQPPHIRGPAKAAVTIEEFGDFQCPPCAALSAVMQKFEHEYSGRLRIIFRHYPLMNHKHARPAAFAAEAAAQQGRFWEMHDMLYQNRPAWSSAADVRPFLDTYAETLGLDRVRFAKDLASEQVKARVNADQERAASLGVTSTPTLFINQRAVPPASLNFEGLRGIIQATIDGKTPL